MKNILKTKRLKVMILICLTLSILMFNTNMAFAQNVLTANSDNLKQTIVDNMKLRNTSFTVNYTGDTQDLINNLDYWIKEAYSSNDYLSLSWKSIDTKISGFYGNANILFNISYWATLEQEQYVEQFIAKTVSELITPNMTDKQKIDIIHKYVVENLQYDKSLKHRSTYDALTIKAVVCQGYAMLLDKMLEYANVESILVTGKITNPDGSKTDHAWNLVRIGDRYYHVDSTNNDNNTYPNRYFLLSDKDLISYGFDWGIINYPKAIASYKEDEDKVIITPIPENPEEVEDNPVVQEPVDDTPTKDDIPYENKILESQKLKLAYDVVSQLKRYRTLSFVRIAQEYVDDLKDSNEKIELQKQIDTVYIEIYKDLIQVAEKSVKKAERYKIRKYYNLANGDVNALDDSDIKLSLSQRLVKLDEMLDKKEILDAEKEVKKAEKYKTRKYLTSAQNKVNILDECDSKTLLEERLKSADKMIDEKELLDAEKAVQKAEKYKKKSYTNTAQKKISILEPSDEKIILQERLNNLKI